MNKSFLKHQKQRVHDWRNLARNTAGCLCLDNPFCEHNELCVTNPRTCMVIRGHLTPSNHPFSLYPVCSISRFLNPVPTMLTFLWSVDSKQARKYSGDSCLTSFFWDFFGQRSIFRPFPVCKLLFSPPEFRLKDFHLGRPPERAEECPFAHLHYLERSLTKQAFAAANTADQMTQATPEVHFPSHQRPVYLLSLLNLIFNFFEGLCFGPIALNNAFEGEVYDFLCCCPLGLQVFCATRFVFPHLRNGIASCPKYPIRVLKSIKLTKALKTGNEKELTHTHSRPTKKML